MAKKLTQEDVILRFIYKHGDLYDYKLVKYKNIRTHVDIICRKHGIFSQTPKLHFKGNGCPTCGLNRPLRYTEQEILKLFNETHGDLYDYSQVVYKGSKVNVDIICRKHGIFSQMPYNHFHRGDGCRKCADEKSIAYHTRGSYTGKPTTLYYVKITTLKDNKIVYKIGLTQTSVKRRFTGENNVKIEIISTWNYPLGEEAFNKEQEILNEYATDLYCGDRILIRGGNTELFTKDVLELT